MKRIVIKIGSQIILDDEESNSNYLSNILNEIVSLKSKGFSFTIVSSGAVAEAVIDTIQTYKTNNLLKFGSIFRYFEQRL